MSGRNISLGLGLHFRSPDDSVGCLVLAVLPGLYALGLWTLRMFAGEVSIEFAQAFSFCFLLVPHFGEKISGNTSFLNNSLLLPPPSFLEGRGCFKQ